MNHQYIHENTFLLTLKLIVLEFCFGVVFLFFTTILDLFELGSGDAILDIISTEGLFTLVVFLIQIGLTIAVILQWNHNYYELSDEQITHHSGVLFLRKKSLYLSEIQEVISKQSVLGRLFNYGDIALVGYDSGVLISLQRVSNPDRYVGEFKKLLSSVKAR